MSWGKLPVRQILAGRHGGEIHGVTEVVLGGTGVRGTQQVPFGCRLSANAPGAIGGELHTDGRLFLHAHNLRGPFNQRPRPLPQGP